MYLWLVPIHFAIATLVFCNPPHCARIVSNISAYPAMWEFGTQVHTQCTHCCNESVAHVHIPKSGGTAVRYSNLHGYSACHVTSRQIRKQAPRARLFVTVRHPLSRYVSAFHHQWYLFDKNRSKPTLVDLTSKATRLLSNPEWWWSPQVRWMMNDDLEVNVNYILQFETLRADYAALRTLEPTLRALATHSVRTSRHPHWCDYLNTTLAGLVAKLYELDYTSLALLYSPFTCVYSN